MRFIKISFFFLLWSHHFPVNYILISFEKLKVSLNMSYID